MGSERLPAKLMHCSTIGRRNQGRQSKKWIENIKEDADIRNTEFEVAIDMVTIESSGDA